MPSPLLLAVDQGSSASRAILFETDGTLAAAASLPVGTAYPRPGWVEQDPKEILETTLAAIRRALVKATKSRPVAAIGLSNQRSTLVIWRRRDGEPVGPALSWQDRRTASFCDALSGKADKIRRRTGLRLSPHYAASKIAWLIRRDRSIRRGLLSGDLLCGTVNSFLIWHLAGGAAHLTDHTNAARMLLLNITTLRWDPSLLSLFEIPEGILPEIRPTFAEFGTAKVGGRFIPIRCSIGDQQAALLGQGCLRSGESVVNYGTGGFFLLHTGRRIERRRGLLTSIASSDRHGAAYLLEGTVNAVGSLLSWTKRLVGLPETASVDEACKRSILRRQAASVVMIPALAGLGAPHWLDRAPFVITGLGAETRGEDLLRASVEAIAYLVRDVYEAMRIKRGIREILVTGGVSKSDYLIQFQSDLLQVSLRRSLDAESSARGAALGAAIGAGLLSPEAIRPSKEGRVFCPRMSKKESDRLYRKWQGIMRAVKASGI